MDDREKEIQRLCSSILDMSTSFWDNPNGPYESSCPICGATEYYGGGVRHPSMDDIHHIPDCAYLIAKDLSTGLK